MAKVTVVIDDTDTEGNVTFRLESDPPFPGPASKEEPTAAQRLAFALVSAVTSSGLYEQIGETEYDGCEFENGEDTDPQAN